MKGLKVFLQLIIRIDLDNVTKMGFFISTRNNYHSPTENGSLTNFLFKV